ncbi:MAG TPA: hypothetical protein VFB12_06675 [Ktedonobacteraceae bacterium]|nr:hypothetical protein [Ktedonobacteraceae bacterium]
MSSTWFITGASCGIGRELTEQVLARGDRVAATLRHPEQLNDLATVSAPPGWWSARTVVQHGRAHCVLSLLALPCHQVGY